MTKNRLAKRLLIVLIIVILGLGSWYGYQSLSAEESKTQSKPIILQIDAWHDSIDQYNYQIRQIERHGDSLQLPELQRLSHRIEQVRDSIADLRYRQKKIVAKTTQSKGSSVSAQKNADQGFWSNLLDYRRAENYLTYAGIVLSIIILFLLFTHFKRSKKLRSAYKKESKPTPKAKKFESNLQRLQEELNTMRNPVVPSKEEPQESPNPERDESEIRQGLDALKDIIGDPDNIPRRRASLNKIIKEEPSEIQRKLAEAQKVAAPKAKFEENLEKTLPPKDNELEIQTLSNTKPPIEPPTDTPEDRRKMDIMKLSRRGYTSSDIARRLRMSQDEVDFLIRMQREKGVLH